MNILCNFRAQYVKCHTCFSKRNADFAEIIDSLDILKSIELQTNKSNVATNFLDCYADA